MPDAPGSANVASFVESLKGMCSKAIGSLITAITSVWAMFDLKFPQDHSYKLLLKGIER